MVDPTAVESKSRSELSELGTSATLQGLFSADSRPVALRSWTSYHQLHDLVREADVKQRVADLGLTRALPILTTRYSISVLGVCRILGVCSRWHKS
jgi:hypothetical protein